LEAELDGALSGALWIQPQMVHIQLYREGSWHHGKLMTAFVTFESAADALRALTLDGRRVSPLTLWRPLAVAMAEPRLVNYNF
jgi:hypothetical protein